MQSWKTSQSVKKKLTVRHRITESISIKNLKAKCVRKISTSNLLRMLSN
jgi:hypothetical protein